MKKQSSILLVDDHPVFRQGLLNLLEKEKDLKVVGEAKDGQIAIDMFRKLSPDIVVMDISMPNLDGIEATRQILSEFPDAKVVALSVHSEKRFIRGMLQSGAAGYILKESIPQEMISGIRTVLAGNAYLSKSISGIVVSDYSSILSDSGSITETQGAPILQTKLHRPQVTSDILPRARLVEILEGGRDRAMTLISAPAGYGKSILASQWLETCPCPYAWVSLDESENDLREFLTYFLAAISSTAHLLDMKTQSLLQAIELPPVKALARYILNDLDLMNEPLILVLDDYHRISEEVVHDLLAELLRHPSPMLHLVLVTRRDPPLPLTSLRAYGQLTEIVVQDLRFTVEEATDLLHRFLRVTVDENTASVLEDKVEGWVTGLRLVALSLHQKKDQSRLLTELRESSYFVQDYLIKEVLSNIPEVYARYLMETSILDRFCAPLCDTLRSTNEDEPEADTDLTGQAFIDWLEDTHLFVIALDGNRQWFRYHHLFQELLQEQLKRRMEPDGIASLHRLAGTWFSDNGLMDEAIGHALAAGDNQFAVQLIRQNRHLLMNTEQWNRLERWLDMLPPETVQVDSILLSTRAWIFEYHSRIVEAWALMDMVEKNLDDLPCESPEIQELQSEINAIRSEQFIIGLEGSRALVCSKEALQSLKIEAASIRGFASVFHALACQMTGDHEKGLRFIEDHAIRDDTFSQNTSYSTRIQIGIMFFHCIAGDQTRMNKAAQQTLKMGELSNLQESISVSKHFLGSFHYIRNELPEVVQYLRTMVDNPHLGRPLYVFHSACALAKAYVAQNRPDEAWSVVDLVTSFLTESNHMLELAMMRAFKVELALMQREITYAIQLDQGVSYELLPPFWFFYEPQLTRVKLLLAQDTTESLQHATDLLSRFYNLVVSIHNIRLQIDALALHALLHGAQGEESAALEKLSESLTLAEPGGFIRNYLDLGPPMAYLLKRLSNKNVPDEYVGQILTAFESENQPVVQQDQPDRHKAHSASPHSDLLFEDLTHRELEVLTHLEKGLSNKEIGSELFLSALTVKKHLYNVYQKLDVKSRIAAISRARELGLLPQD